MVSASSDAIFYFLQLSKDQWKDANAVDGIDPANASDG